MNMRQHRLSPLTIIIMVIVIVCGFICFSSFPSDARLVAVYGRSAQFWRTAVFAVVTVRSWRKIERRYAEPYLANVRVLSILAAEHPIPANAQIYINEGKPYYTTGPIHPGGTFLVFMQKWDRSGYYITGDIGAPTIMPRGLQSWPVSGISDPLIKFVRARIKKLAAAAGAHPRAWIPQGPATQTQPVTAPDAKKQMRNSSWLPWGHDYTTYTGSNFRERFWATNAVVVLRVDRLLPQRYIGSYYPPMATEISARVVLVCATDLPVPTKIKLTCIWAKGIVGTVLPPLPLVKPGALFLARIYTLDYYYGRNKGNAVKNWLIQPNILVAFMPAKMSLVPISGLDDPKLRQTEIKVAAARKKYWEGWARNKMEQR